MKRALITGGMLVLGSIAAIGIYLVCVVVIFLAGGWVQSIVLGAAAAPVITISIVIHRWIWRRDGTSRPMMGAMTMTQIVLAGLAVADIIDSPSTLGRLR